MCCLAGSPPAHEPIAAAPTSCLCIFHRLHNNFYAATRSPDKSIKKTRTLSFSRHLVTILYAPLVLAVIIKFTQTTNPRETRLNCCNVGLTCPIARCSTLFGYTVWKEKKSIVFTKPLPPHGCVDHKFASCFHPIRVSSLKYTPPVLNEAVAIRTRR